MALLRLLRALDKRRPDWLARVSSLGNPPVATLYLASPVKQGDLLESADLGIRWLSGTYVDEKNATFTAEAFRNYARRAAREGRYRQAVREMADADVTVSSNHVR